MMHGSIARCLLAAGLAIGIPHAAVAAGAVSPVSEAQALCIKTPTRACMLEWMVRDTLAVQDGRSRTEYLMLAADLQAKNGLRTEAETTANLALNEAKSRTSSWEREEIFIGVANVWARLRKFAEARQLADAVDNANLRADVLAFSAVEIGRIGKIGDGLHVVQSITEVGIRDRAVRRVVWDLRFVALERGEEGKLIDALRIVEEEEEPMGGFTGHHHTSEVIPALQIIAEALAKKGRFAEAWPLAASAKHSGDRWTALVHIGRMQINAGGVTAFLQEAHLLDDTELRKHVLRDVLEASFDAFSKWGYDDDEPEAAREIPGINEREAADARTIAQAFSSGEERAVANGIVTVAQARNGDIAQAQQTAQAIDDDKARFLALRGIGRAQAKAGQNTQSVASFEEALRLMQPFEARGARDRYLADLAEDQADAGQIAEAIRVVQAMDGNLSNVSIGVGDKMVNGDHQRRYVLRAIARAQAKAGNVTEALATERSTVIEGAHQILGSGPGVVAEGLADGGRIADAIEASVHGKRERTLTLLIDEQVAAGKITEALQCAEAIDDPKEKTKALAVVGRAQTKAGRKADATATFARAAQIAEGVTPPDNRAAALLQIVRQMPE